MESSLEKSSLVHLRFTSILKRVLVYLTNFYCDPLQHYHCFIVIYDEKNHKLASFCLKEPSFLIY